MASSNLFDRATENVKPSVAPVKDRFRTCGYCGAMDREPTMEQRNGLWFHDKNCLRGS